MAWVATEDFESYSLGSDPIGQNGGTGWAGAWTGGGPGSNGWVVENTVVLEGTKSISCSPNNVSDEFLDRTLATGTISGQLQFYGRRDLNNSGTLNMGFFNGAPSGASLVFAIQFDASGNITIQGSSTVTVGTYAANTNYKIGIDYNNTTNLFSANINDGAFSSSVGRFSGGGNITIIRVSVESSTTATSYFDGIGPYAATPAGPTTVKTWDGVTQSTGIKTYFGTPLANVKTLDGLS